MRAHLASGLLALGLGVAACSGGDDVTAPPLPPITEAPSASPSPTAEPVPSEATAATPEGAAEFVRAWFEELNNAAGSGETAGVTRLSDPGCATCSSFIQSIASLYDAGGLIEGGEFSVTTVEAQPVDGASGEARVLVIYDVSPTRQVGAQGETLLEVDALTGEAGDLVLRHSGDSWTMREFR